MYARFKKSSVNVRCTHENPNRCIFEIISNIIKYLFSVFQNPFIDCRKAFYNFIFIFNSFINLPFIRRAVKRLWNIMVYPPKLNFIRVCFYKINGFIRIFTISHTAKASDVNSLCTFFASQNKIWQKSC